MRHRKSGRKFNMDSTARKAMFRNMVTSLMLHGQIRTTQARAKELRRFAERVITMGKRAPSKSTIEGLSGDDLRQARADRVAAIRRVRKWVNNPEALNLVFDEYAERFRARPGGYTRVLKMGQRAGDNAKMALIALVGDFDPNAAASAPEADEPEAVEEAPVADAAAADEEAVAVEQPEGTEEDASIGTDFADDDDDDDQDATVVMTIDLPEDDADGEVVED
jgi:large subunit ribosomal protein L17